jgi:hypothetical protein
VNDFDPTYLLLEKEAGRPRHGAVSTVTIQPRSRKFSLDPCFHVRKSNPVVDVADRGDHRRNMLAIDLPAERASSDERHAPIPRASLQRMTMLRTRSAVEQKLNVRTLGAGDRTMLFAHGFGCDQNMWRYVAPAFEAEFRTVLFDYVGSGGSDLTAYDAGKYSSLNGYAEDVIERRMRWKYPAGFSSGTRSAR